MNVHEKKVEIIPICHIIKQAASSKQQAASSKQQAASSKQQAASSKQQAASSKQVAFCVIENFHVQYRDGSRAT
ncbi:hypothetical protein [Paenibacillus wenxiniae]|uniref:hypothetical protein n=1 Tax=Paenibacillus wenxiniae TaxID=1636843 RepID=UPI003221EECA